MSDQLTEAKCEFLHHQIWINCWNASVQHIKTFRDGINQNRKIDLKAAWEELTRDEVRKSYCTGKPDEQSHLELIETVRDEIIKTGEAVLHTQTFSYASAQKLVNLYLKYQWCLGNIGEPLHCPLDRFVIQNTSLKNLNWTDIQNRNEYIEIINAVRFAADGAGKSIPAWELSIWSGSSPRGNEV
jgi:hypothetical protein